MFPLMLSHGYFHSGSVTTLGPDSVDTVDCSLFNTSLIFTLLPPWPLHYLHMVSVRFSFLSFKANGIKCQEGL